MKCTHDAAEIDTAAIADGLCPLCLHQENQRLREALKKISDMFNGTNLGAFKSHPAQIARKALANATSTPDKTEIH